MSQQNALKFIDDVRHDPALRMKLSQLGPNEIEAVIDIATLSGYEFSRDDYLKAVREYQRMEAMPEGGMGPLSRVPGFNH
jgi:predicted ribosomally synthesized peptide with nif11-like leader